MFCDAKAPLSICASITILVPISWLAATLREFLRLKVGVSADSASPFVPSARLLCHGSGAMRFPLAREPEPMVHIDIRGSMVRRREKQTLFGTTTSPSRHVPHTPHHYAPAFTRPR